MRYLRSTKRWLLPLIVTLVAAPALSAEADEQGLFFQPAPGEPQRTIGPSGSIVHVEVTGIVATVTVWQLFENPSDRSIDASYVFPVPENVAVDRLQIQIGDRAIVGTVREKEQAREIFLLAASEGRAASLVEHRHSNVFSTSVANIPPRELVEIVIGWQQEVVYRDGTFTLRLPTMLMPRYRSGSAEPVKPTGQLLPGVLGSDRAALPFGIRVDLLPGLPVATIASPSHAVAVQGPTSGVYSVTLKETVAMTDRDFVLEWRPALQQTPRMQLLSTTQDGTRYLMMFLVPPAESGRRQSIPREVVFVIDTSGSMEGGALHQAKVSLIAALDGLGPLDTFNVVRFSSEAQALGDHAMPATEAARQQARKWIGDMSAGGGTNMLSALELALDERRPRSRVRQVVFITDGLVENENQLFRYIANNLGQSRLFTVGIGDAPNSYFLRNAARHGRGDFKYVESVARVESRISTLLARLDTAVMTDVSIVLPGALADVQPNPVPDLYSGQPLIVTARLEGGSGAIEVDGWQGDVPWTQAIALPDAADEGRSTTEGAIELPAGRAATAIRKLWAARKIEALTDRLLTFHAPPDEIRRQVTAIALRHQLVTQYTSLVAEDEHGGTTALAPGLTVAVADDNGTPLPGVSVTVEGEGGPRVNVTGPTGEVQFSALGAGTWYLKAELDGFSTVEHPNLMIQDGASVMVRITLSDAIEDIITVTSESPLLDERRLSVGTDVSQPELDRIPTSRDAWSVLSRTPGVLVDRIDAGQQQSGERPGFRGPGVSGEENAVLIDGFEISDAASDDGASETYYVGFFETLESATGGIDVAKSTAGVSVNLVTKRGTNEFRGSAAFLKTGGSLLGDPSHEAPDADLAEGQESFVGNTVGEIQEYGFEAGGPVLLDRLWLWGSAGARDGESFTGGADPDDAQPTDALLETVAFSTNLQVASANSSVGSWIHGDRHELGRGAGPARPPETTLDQESATTVLTLEDSHVFSANFYLTGLYGSVDSGTRLVPRATRAGDLSGEEAPEALWDAGGVWRDNYRHGSSNRSSEEWKLTGSYFTDISGSSHEIRFGGRSRELETHSRFGWPGRDLLHLDGGLFELPDPLGVAVAHRGERARVTRELRSLWVQDTVAAGSFTGNVGFRWDLQQGYNGAATVDGNSAFPELLPDVVFDGAKAPFDWQSISPRLGLTYALGQDRDTILRLGVSQFPERLSAAHVAHSSPSNDAWALLLFADGNGNRKYDDPTNDSSGDALLGLVGWSGFDPASVRASIPVNRADSGLDPATVSELTLSADQSFLPELTVGLGFTYRVTDDVLETRDIVRGGELATGNDYRLDRILSGSLPDGAPYSEPVYGLIPRRTGGAHLMNGDREIEYAGLALTLVKRLAHGWATRAYFSAGDAEWRVPASYRGGQDPTGMIGGQPGFLRGRAGDRDGDLFVGHAGSGCDTCSSIQRTWSFNFSGMYQLAPRRPWGFNLAGSFHGSQGTVLPYHHLALGSDGLAKAVRVTENLDDFRTGDLFRLDLRLEKDLGASRDSRFTVALDALNLFDRTPGLERELVATAGQYDWLRATASPRTWRLGVRLEWK